jgi:hypothetical protein
MQVQATAAGVTRLPTSLNVLGSSKERSARAYAGICGFVVCGALLFSLLKFPVAIASHVPLPSDFLQTWAYGISPCHKGKNRDEKKPVSEIAGALCFEFLVAKYCSDVPLPSEFLAW